MYKRVHEYPPSWFDTHFPRFKKKKILIADGNQADKKNLESMKKFFSKDLSMLSISPPLQHNLRTIGPFIKT